MILDKVNFPADLKSLSISDLSYLCVELRNFLPQSTAAKEGHINSSLGVTELTVALHYVLNTPHDILIWDVGHQAYIHKILTGRKNIFNTNRQRGGLSGFTKRAESEYDPFGAGHSSTSISAVSGFAMADNLKNIDRQHVAVIGDGALTGGMAFEALNYAGEHQLDILIILNDNGASIDDNVGSLSFAKRYRQFCESLSINYLGDIDGNNVDEVINQLKEAITIKGPRMLRAITQKGIYKKEASVAVKEKKSFQDVFSTTLREMAKADKSLVVMSPAMLSGAGLGSFKKEFPERTFDVGIAEQHAVTLAAGMAADGLLPVVHLYSTFAQRAYDQIIHDVALQDLHVIFCLDRAGVVGEDGATHHGNFDPGFLNTIPGVTIAASLDGKSLEQLMQLAHIDKGPWFIRYPKDECEEMIDAEPLKKGGARLLRPGKEKVVLSFGAVGESVKNALQGSTYAHYDFPFLKPLDKETLTLVAANFQTIITVEENSPRGGLGDSIRAFFAEMKIDVYVKSLTLPDLFIEHASRAELLEMSGLNEEGIKQFVLNA